MHETDDHLVAAVRKVRRNISSCPSISMLPRVIRTSDFWVGGCEMSISPGKFLSGPEIFRGANGITLKHRTEITTIVLSDRGNIVEFCSRPFITRVIIHFFNDFGALQPPPLCRGGFIDQIGEIHRPHSGQWPVAGGRGEPTDKYSQSIPFRLAKSQFWRAP